MLMFGATKVVVIRCRVSSFQGHPYFRGVFISGVSLFQGVLISWTSLFQEGPYFRCLCTSRVSLFQGCPHLRDVLTFSGIFISRVSSFQGVLISGVYLFHGVLILRVSYFRSVLIKHVSIYYVSCTCAHTYIQLPHPLLQFVPLIHSMKIMIIWISLCEFCHPKLPLFYSKFFVYIIILYHISVWLLSQCLGLYKFGVFFNNQKFYFSTILTIIFLKML